MKFTVECWLLVSTCSYCLFGWIPCCNVMDMCKELKLLHSSRNTSLLSFLAEVVLIGACLDSLSRPCFVSNFTKCLQCVVKCSVWTELLVTMDGYEIIATWLVLAAFFWSATLPLYQSSHLLFKGY